MKFVGVQFRRMLFNAYMPVLYLRKSISDNNFFRRQRTKGEMQPHRSVFKFLFGAGAVALGAQSYKRISHDIEMAPTSGNEESNAAWSFNFLSRK